MKHSVKEVITAVELANDFNEKTDHRLYIQLCFWCDLKDMIELHSHFKTEGYFSDPFGKFFARDSRLFFHFLLGGNINASVEIRAIEDSITEFLIETE